MTKNHVFRVDLVVDFICPWSFLALRRVTSAIEQVKATGKTIDFDLKIESYQLNPNMPVDGVDRKKYRSEKFGSWEKSLEREKAVQAMSLDVGITFHFEKIAITPNTELAHRFLQIAKQQNLDVALAEAVFSAYFEEGVNIGDLKELILIARRVGVSEPQIAKALLEDASLVAVKKSQHDWFNRGIHGVPFMAIPSLNMELPGVVTTSRIAQLLTQATEHTLE